MEKYGKIWKNIMPDNRNERFSHFSHVYLRARENFKALFTPKKYFSLPFIKPTPTPTPGHAL